MRRAWLASLVLLAGCAGRSFLGGDSRAEEQQRAEEQALSDANALRALREEAQRPPDDAPSEPNSGMHGAPTP